MRCISVAMVLVLAGCGDDGLGGWEDRSPGVGVSLHGVWGASPDDVWVVGREGTILHWNGSGWTPFDSGTNEILWDVWGSGSDAVWVAGNGTLLFWNGASWRRETSDHGLGALDYGSISGSGPADVRVTTGVASSAVDFVQWNGSAWSPVDTACGPFPRRISVGDASEWLIATDEICGGSPGQWAVHRPEYPGVVMWKDIWPTGIGAWAVGVTVTAAASANLAAHFDGNQWAVHDDLPGESSMEAIAGDGPSDFWIAGSRGELRHWDGTSWSLVEVSDAVGHTFWDLWVEDGEVWAVGEFGSVFVRPRDAAP